MARFFARRLAGFAAVLLALSFIIFSLLDLVPGDPVKILVGTRRLTPEVRAAITAQYGLDEPLLLRYWHWFERSRGILATPCALQLPLLTSSPHALD